VRNIAVQGRLRIIVSCDPKVTGDDPNALNMLLCLAQIPELSSVPIFLQCRSAPKSISTLDNVVIVSNPRQLLSLATVSAVQPELFSPSALRSSSQSAGDLAMSLLKQDPSSFEVTETSNPEPAAEASVPKSTTLAPDSQTLESSAGGKQKEAKSVLQQVPGHPPPKPPKPRSTSSESEKKSEKK